MRKFIYILVLTLVVLFELFIAVQPMMTGNPARVPYRRQERYAALKAMDANPSSETKAAFWHELQLAASWETRQKIPQCALMFVALSLLDAVCIWPYWSSIKKELAQT